MSDDLVTIARFPTTHEAELLRGQLLENGIPSVLAGAQIAESQPFPAAGWATVLVQVRAPDAAAAARLVAEHDAQHAARHGRPLADTCLACGTPLQPRDLRCAACGWTWIDERAS